MQLSGPSVPTAEHEHSGPELQAQQANVRALAAAQGWTLVAEHSDIASGKDSRRPGFQAALARCGQLGAVRAAAPLDRITRHAHTLSGLPAVRGPQRRSSGLGTTPGGEAGRAPAGPGDGAATGHGR